MAKVKSASVGADRLKSFVDRIEKVEEEQKAIADDKRDIYAEAKGVGFDVKTIRWIVQERKADAADRAERDTLRDTYAHALGMAVDLVQVSGLSLRQAEAATGVSKSSIQRALAVPAVSQDHREMVEDDLGKIERPAAFSPGTIDMVKGIARAMGGERLTVVENDGPAVEIDLAIPDRLRRVPA